MPDYSKSHQVYLAIGPIGAKIGVSCRVHARIKELGPKAVRPQLVRVWDRPKDARIVELLAHQILAPKVCKGWEWFNVTERQAVIAIGKAIKMSERGHIPEPQCKRMASKRRDLMPPEKVAALYDCEPQTVYSRYNSAELDLLRKKYAKRKS